MSRWTAVPAVDSGPQEAPTPLIAIVGPTGTGKSDLAVELALRLGGEVVNADSMQFYRGMDIGTAKLSTVERRGVRHHLLDVLDVTEEASVSAFQARCREVVAEIRSRGLRPILAGGSGLYIRAAVDVLEFPGTDPAVRRRIEEETEAHGVPALRERLRAVDPQSAERLRDRRRMVRALEVHEISGRPFSSFMPSREYLEPTVQIGLDIERPLLHARLAHRVRAMVDAGLHDEVARLAASGLREGPTASRAVGYAQFLRVLDGASTVAEAVEDTVVATRRLARRQSTWFRADSRVRWLDGLSPNLVECAVGILEA